VLGRFRDEGWQGPNLQMRRGRDSWHIIKLNPRVHRLVLWATTPGLDEVRWIVNRWLDTEIVPPWPLPPVARVQRHLLEVGNRRHQVDLREPGRRGTDVPRRPLSPDAVLQRPPFATANYPPSRQGKT
jgi:hypothetical protein